MGTPVYPQALLDELSRAPAAVAFEHGAREVTRAEVLDLIAGYTSGLRAAGVGPRSGVAIATEVTPEGFAVQMAANVLGARVVGVRPGLSASHLEHILDDVEYLLVDQRTRTPELEKTAGVCTVLTVGPDLLGDTAPPTPRGNPEDVAWLAFTSGSTGVPKGSAFTYAAMSGNWSWQPSTWGEWTTELASRYHRYLLFGTLTSAVMFEHLGLSLLSGGTAVIPEGPPDFPRVVERLRISACLLTVPRLYNILDVLRDTDVDMSSLRSVIVAGSPLAPHRLAEGFERLGSALRQAYGQTEDGMLTLLTKADVERRPETLASVGRICEKVSLEIRDADGTPVPHGRTGEIWVRTPGQLCGYWNDEAETAEVLRDGWVRTRDLGHQGDDGFLYLTGRARDIVIVNAIIHYAGPIEQALAAHPDVDQAYVVGLPDERTGEAVHAVIVAEPARRPDPEELRAAVSRSLGEAAVPAAFHFVTEVPQTPGGKPDKRALAAGLGA